MRNEDLRTQLGIAEVQDQPIAASFLQGQAAAIQRQAALRSQGLSNQAQSLQSRVADAQRRRQAAIEAAKARYDYESSASSRLADMYKPTNVGDSLIRLNPQTGKYETVYSSPKAKQAEVKELNGVLYERQSDGKWTAVAGSEKAANRDTQVVNIGGRQVLIDKNTGQTVADLGKAGSSIGDMTSGQASAFMTITNKYQADPIVNQGLKGIQAASIADQVIADPYRSTNQLKALYSLMKNLDPDSAVREGEVQLAQKTQSFWESFKTSLDRAVNGQIMSPDAARDLAIATKELAQTWSEAAKRRQAQYASQADVVGVGDPFMEYIGGFQSDFGIPGMAGSSPSGTQATNSPQKTDAQLIAEEEARRGMTLSPAARQQFLAQKRAEASNNPLGSYLDSAYGQGGFKTGLGTPQNGQFGSQVENLALAIRTHESGGNYSAKGASTEGGAYQFMPATWKEWAGKYLGNPNAQQTKENQDFVAKSKIADLLKQGYNERQVALIWNGGQPVEKKGVNKYGVPYDTAKYANNVLAIYNKAKAA